MIRTIADTITRFDYKTMKFRGNTPSDILMLPFRFTPIKHDDSIVFTNPNTVNLVLTYTYKKMKITKNIQVELQQCYDIDKSMYTEVEENEDDEELIEDEVYEDTL